MALFKKETCPVCGQLVKGMFNEKIKDKKTLCADCSRKISMEVSMLPFQTAEDIKEHLIYRDENLKLYQTFSVTKELKCGSEYLREDAKMRKWYFTGYQDPENPEIYDYNEIIDYELTEDGVQIAKGGLGSAVAGGMMFGGVGAIVGSNVGSKKINTIVEDISLRVSLKNKYRQEITIRFLPYGIKDVKRGSSLYKTYKYAATSAVSFFDNMCSKVNVSSVSSDQSRNVSIADEILKFKSLLDADIITPEEFEAKKKELLNL